MSQDPLDRPADRATLQALYKAGLLHLEARDAALQLIRPPLGWWRWASRLLLSLGSALVLAGVVFFFAYNWSEMGTMTRFALIECGLFGCAIASRLIGPDTAGGKILVLSASMLVGVFLAVFGQVYQTGADAWELFRAWALLILGWVIVARFAGLWILWLVVVNVGLALYWDQTTPLDVEDEALALALVLGLLDGLFLGAREYGLHRGLEWLRGGWVRAVLLLTVLGCLTAPAMVVVTGRQPPAIAWIGTLAWAVALATTYALYRHHFRDLFALTAGTFSVCAVFIAFISQGLLRGPDSALSFLLLGLITLGVSAAAALWLIGIGRAMREERHA